MFKPWMREILRRPEGEDGGGVVFVTDEGALDANDPATVEQDPLGGAAPSRDDKLEARLGKLEQSITNFLTGQTKKEQSSQQIDLERRIKAAEANATALSQQDG